MAPIEDGLRVQDGFGQGPLAEAALRRWTEAVQVLHNLQERADTMTGAQIYDQVHWALRHYMQRQPPTGQVARIAELVRSGVPLNWVSADTLPLASDSHRAVGCRTAGYC